MQIANLGVSIKTAIVIGGLALIMAVPASAALRINTTGGTSCKGLSGFGATLFYFSNEFAENTSDGPQYLTCQIPTLHNASTVTPLTIEIVFENGSDVAGTATCALQTGINYGANVVSTAVYNIELPANGSAFRSSNSGTTPALPASPAQFAPYAMTCLIPPGGKLGLISVIMPGSLVH